MDSLDKAQLTAGLMAGLMAGLIPKNDIFDSDGLMIALFACIRGQLTQPLNYLLN
ncbi:MAG: hypothetical protein IGS16_04725 [Thermoleptolyngbya sp. C42_A2020_037]|nr:hypothetical protein [Thermoleptolyngbya sp. C42_A2020_037]